MDDYGCDRWEDGGEEERQIVPRPGEMVVDAMQAFIALSKVSQLSLMSWRARELGLHLCK